jgi:peroxiredoxin
MVPHFELVDARVPDGEAVAPRRYRGRRQLVLVFAHNPGCRQCQDLLSALAARHDDYAEEEAVVLAIVPLPVDEAAGLARDLALPFPVLADSDGSAHARFGALLPGGGYGSDVYVTDRYGEVQARWLAGEGHEDLPNPEQIAEYLRFASIQCPE